MNAPTNPRQSQLRRRRRSAARQVSFVGRSGPRQISVRGNQRLPRQIPLPDLHPRTHTGRLAGVNESSTAALPSDDTFAKELYPSPSTAMSSATASVSGPASAETPHIPKHFTQPPLLSDSLLTETSILQDATMDDCLLLLRGHTFPPPIPVSAARSASASSTTQSYSFLDDQSGLPDTNSWRALNKWGLPPLDRAAHAAFLKDTLEEMPSQWVSMDPSRPWVVYWALCGLSTLGRREEAVTEYRERAIQHILAAQNPEGGIGGGHGHLSHLAPSYAAILSLAILGEGALDCVDRRGMWKWLGSLKQDNGGFAVSQGAEIDVRGAYCSMTIIALLNLPLELPPDAPARSSGLSSFTDKLPEWLSKCQTYEGGISGAPGTEAHGGYAFCALACACILGDPKDVIPRIFDMPSLISWISARQYAPEGGLSGRTNKLVDGCYSHWVGGCWPLIEAAVGKAVGEGLYSREGLIRYILCCCQSPYGGLRDKPGKSSDGYHTCYVLAGLSAVQHRSGYEQLENEVGSALGSAFRWVHVSEGGKGGPAGGEPFTEAAEAVEPIHPVFAIPFEAVEETRAWTVSKTGF